MKHSKFVSSIRYQVSGIKNRLYDWVKKYSILDTEYCIQRDGAGVVALITSIIVSLLLLVITTSGVALMTSELRQASDYDQSVKAYYAAEAGVEDALAAIRRAAENSGQVANITPSSPGCEPVNDPFELDPQPQELAENISYTCQIVTLESDPVTGSLDAEETVQLDLSGIGQQHSNYRVIVEWNQQASGPGEGADPQQITGIPTGFPPNTLSPDHQRYWPGRFPAVVETTFVEFPDATFQASDIKDNIVVLKPAAAGQTSVPWTDNVNPPREARCRTVPEGEYNCRMEFRGFSPNPNNPQNYILRLKARYSQAHYRVSVVSAAGSSITIPKGQILVDVTGQAGEVFRRVLVKIPLSSQPRPNNIVLADDSICKLFEVSKITGRADEPRGCPSY